MARFPLMLTAAGALALSACSPEPSQPEAPPVPAEPAPPPVAAPETPYVGVWRGPQASCDNAPGSGEAAPIRITGATFEGYENRCDIRNVTRVGTAHEAVLDCVAEGTTASERVRMAVEGEVLELTYLDREGAAVRFERCPA